MRSATTVLALCAMTAAACGSGAQGDGGFRFTPVPYEYVDGMEGLNEGRSRVPLSLPPDVTANRCYPYVADEVLVDIDPEDAGAFKQWLDSVGFSVRREDASTRSPFPTSLLVGVPLGSVPDAISAIRERTGVVGAGTNSLGKIPEDPNLPICPTPDAPG